jgi:hypothetical protein
MQKWYEGIGKEGSKKVRRRCAAQPAASELDFSSFLLASCSGLESGQAIPLPRLLQAISSARVLVKSAKLLLPGSRLLSISAMPVQVPEKVTRHRARRCVAPEYTTLVPTPASGVDSQRPIDSSQGALNSRLPAMETPSHVHWAHILRVKPDAVSHFASAIGHSVFIGFVPEGTVWYDNHDCMVRPRSVDTMSTLRGRRYTRTWYCC